MKLTMGSWPVCVQGKTLTGSVQYLERTVAILGQAQWRATTEQGTLPLDASVVLFALSLRGGRLFGAR